MQILLVTDAWYPQVNGVVRTLDTVAAILRNQGHAVHLLTPQEFATLPCPTYPEIRLSLFPGRRVAQVLDEYATGAIHIATEGPLGIAARRICLRRGLPFTTSFHTRFPEYVNARLRIPVGWLYSWLRRFHNSGAAVMVATPTLQRELAARGFENIRTWNRGVDTHLFRPREKSFLDHLPRPIWLNVGRVAIEKNIDAFLALPLEGTKLVVGDGPRLAELKKKYPDVYFAGAKRGEELARFYSASDVFVFPSRTDTFGLVILEALASGLPVAALPVPGPVDVIGGSRTGVLDEDLAKASREALEIPPERCVAYAQQFSWEQCAGQFLQNLYPASASGLTLAAGD